MADAGAESDCCFALPLLPGRVGEARDLWKKLHEDRAEEFGQYLRETGISRLLIFLQSLPGGEFLVTLLGTTGGIRPAFEKGMTSASPMAKYLRESYADLTSIDFSSQRNVPDLEMLRYWEDYEREGLSSVRSAFAIPIRPGKTDSVRRFFAALEGGKIGDEAPIFHYQTVGKIESFLQHRPEGDYLVEYVESAKPIREVMRMGLGSGKPLSDFIRKEFSEFCDLPLPLAPDIDLIYEWDGNMRGPGGATGMARTG